MTITLPYQAELNGLTIGKGTLYRYETMPEGFGIPPIRTSDFPFPSNDGEIPGNDYLSARTLVFNLILLGTSAVSTETLAQALAAAWRPKQTIQTLNLEMTGQQYVLYGRPRGCSIVYDRSLLSAVAKARCVFKATDPYFYDYTSSVNTLALAGATGVGMTFNATFNLGFGGASSGGITNVTNNGTVPTQWVASISGPLVDPRLENVSTGEILRFTGNLASGDVLTIDSATHTILVNGTSALSWLQAGSSWFTLASGTNQIRLAAISGSGSGTISFRSAWL